MATMCHFLEIVEADMPMGVRHREAVGTEGIFTCHWLPLHLRVDIILGTSLSSEVRLWLLASSVFLGADSHP